MPTDDPMSEDQSNNSLYGVAYGYRSDKRLNGNPPELERSPLGQSARNWCTKRRSGTAPTPPAHEQVGAVLNLACRAGLQLPRGGAEAITGQSWPHQIGELTSGFLTKPDAMPLFAASSEDEHVHPY